MMLLVVDDQARGRRELSAEKILSHVATFDDFMRP